MKMFFYEITQIEGKILNILILYIERDESIYVYVNGKFHDKLIN